MRRTYPFFLVLPLLAGCNPFAPSLAKMCEEVLLTRTAAFDLETRELVQPIAAEEYRALRLADARREGDAIYKHVLSMVADEIAEIEAGDRTPRRYSYLLTFDVAGRGRTNALCEYIAMDGSISDLAVHFLTIDGLTQGEYLARAIAASK